MQFKVPQSNISFEIADEWCVAGDLFRCELDSAHYRCATAGSQFVAITDIEPPLRDGNLVWFRDRESVVQLLKAMHGRQELPPIEIWSKLKKQSSRYIVRDGLHRFYLSIAFGYTKIPVIFNDWNMEEFLINEARKPQ